MQNRIDGVVGVFSLQEAPVTLLINGLREGVMRRKIGKPRKFSFLSRAEIKSKKQCTESKTG